MTLADNIKDTAAVHGVAWAARHYAKKGVNIDAVLHALGMRRVGVR
jgi:predicted lysophospholipase L1 biosynthesis ABC-type transport system permease subunit